MPKKKKSRTIVTADIHGSYKALKQCLKKSKFDYENDTLICLGDTADGWVQTAECFEELFKIKNLIYIRGNHDQWLKDWLKKGKKPDVWQLQGGKNTTKSYMKHPELMKPHLKFLSTTKFYHIDDQNRVFVHGGVSQKGKHPKDCDKMFLSWDREMWDNRHNLKKNEWKEVYVGHTSIWKFSHKPLTYGNVTFMDLGCGWEGSLAFMDIDTKEVWMSDQSKNLYQNDGGRRRQVPPAELKEILEKYRDINFGIL